MANVRQIDLLLLDILMDGLDMHDTLAREIPLNHVLEQKVRPAAETGESMARVRELFP
jgi:hypothetical protein